MSIVASFVDGLMRDAEIERRHGDLAEPFVARVYLDAEAFDVPPQTVEGHGDDEGMARDELRAKVLAMMAGVMVPQ